MATTTTVTIRGTEVQVLNFSCQVQWMPRPKYTTRTTYSAYLPGGSVQTDYRVDMERYLAGHRDGFNGCVILSGLDVIERDLGEDVLVEMYDTRRYDAGHRGVPAASYLIPLRAVRAAANELGESYRFAEFGSVVRLSNRGRWEQTRSLLQFNELPDLVELRRA